MTALQVVVTRLTTGCNLARVMMGFRGAILFYNRPLIYVLVSRARTIMLEVMTEMVKK